MNGVIKQVGRTKTTAPLKLVNFFQNRKIREKEIIEEIPSHRVGAARVLSLLNVQE